ncbi:hypothetical protein FHX59_005715 [Paraburkholderia silvatlantica]|uniref:Uncharacterized protein n=1 Tax=Paraburkholderia silvatlantica TaxID=321895 RepID=A0ABR6FWU1_9BURK|nr:hypothetical protein [Paraburkholderia silvatlantica]
MMAVALELVGEHRVIGDFSPFVGGEDFAYYL